MKKIWRSVNICQSYGQKHRGPFFETQCTCFTLYVAYEIRTTVYYLRVRRHNYSLVEKISELNECDCVTRILYKNCYIWDSLFIVLQVVFCQLDFTRLTVNIHGDATTVRGGSSPKILEGALPPSAPSSPHPFSPFSETGKIRKIRTVCGEKRPP